MKSRVMMVAFSAVILAAPLAGAQSATTNVGNTQKGSVPVKKSGEGAGTQGDSSRMLAATVKTNPPCQGTRMRPADASPSVNGSPGGMASPDQVAPLPPKTRTKKQMVADSIRAANASVPNCAGIADSVHRARRANTRDSLRAAHSPLI